MTYWGWSGWTWWQTSSTNVPPAWDDGIEVHPRQIEPPDMALDPLTVAFVRDDYLRAPNGTLEDAFIERAIRASYRAAERVTRRALIPQTWDQVMTGWPIWTGQIVLAKAPVLEVLAISYVDEAGDEQSLTTSPADYAVTIPSGPLAGKATVQPVYGASWPAARELVTVRYRAGYPLLEDESPAVADIPEDITHGRLLMIGEMYKQRSESVHSFNSNPAVIRARDLWIGYRVY